MEITVEVEDWEHECCGPAYERNAVIELTCLVVPDDSGQTHYVETHHDLVTPYRTTQVRGRVSDLQVEHLNGSSEQIERVPGGSALRGFDDDDDGHLEQPWTAKAVVNDSNRFLVTIVR